MAANPNYQPMFEGDSTPSLLVQLSNGTPGTLASPITMSTVNANDIQHINRITVASSDSAPRTFTLVLTDGSLINVLGAVNIPLGSGTVAGTAAVDILASITGPCMADAAGNKFIEIPKGWTLKGFASALTAATFMYVTVTGRTLGVAV